MERNIKKYNYIYDDSDNYNNDKNNNNDENNNNDDNNNINNCDRRNNNYHYHSSKKSFRSGENSEIVITMVISIKHVIIKSIKYN